MDDSARLAYVCSQNVGGDEGTRGALLLTDGETKPLEFWVTAPVKSTELQRLLYGKTLERHILVGLLALPLLGKVKEKLTFVIIKQTALLALRLKVAHPVLLAIRKSGNAHPATPDQVLASANPVLIDCGDGNQIELRTLKGHEEELAPLHDSLKKFCASCGLLDPFDRIDAVLGKVPVGRPGGK